MIKENIKIIREGKIKKNKYIVYWMQAAQRVENNPALNYAIQKANEIEVPLFVFFNLTDNFPDANYRHYYFMLEGLKEVEEKLKNKDIKFIIKTGDVTENITALSKNAVMVVTDRGYLKVIREWKKKIAELIDCRFLMVNTNTIVPVDIVSDKEEYAAYTIRKKVLNKIDRFIDVCNNNYKLENKSVELNFKGLKLDNIDKVINNLDIDKSVKPSKLFTGGRSEAVKRLDYFINNKLSKYEEYGSNPDQDCTSKLSPYLHFGQISPHYIYKRIKKSEIKADSFIEQLVVRRELSFNYIYYNDNYDNSLKNILPDWAYKSLMEHIEDKREFNYSLKDLENYETHDEYWNTAQKEMVLSGYMNGYMRMYWGKKILEWTNDPQKAFDIALYLNNKYLLDGRDPNGYTGVAWIFGKHDRAWKERKIFGKVRYMNKNGLDRKFNMEKYLKKVSKLG
ncbi:MAG: deoxyribodipyrimidine photo-lyase [Halanaerobiales bacterium]|nr:deoxyribodipyrimidine photo-lyase [Halanaerobiales bacterium]